MISTGERGEQNKNAAMPAIQTLIDTFSSGSTAKVVVFAAALIFFGLVGRYRRSTTQTGFQEYDWDTSTAGGVKKRWLWESLRLLREGYNKVRPTLSPEFTLQVD